jgi:hypothetical protein
MTTGGSVWGVKLSGHVFDLEDWRDAFREPFDPSVLHEGDEYFLRASEFQSCDSAEEVLAIRHSGARLSDDAADAVSSAA